MHDSGYFNVNVILTENVSKSHFIAEIQEREIFSHKEERI